ncbi:coiled-coil domain-containing protein 167-like [Ptychodera flava]|uniref:coiled-coil domain-containing protein 167-like n=1 Tax=Ptychodera flava TaxID=63121 RepID=UPI00396A323A
MTSIVSQIETLEDNLKRFRDRLDGVEKSLNSSSISDKQRDLLEEEEQELTKTIEEHEKDLKSLRAENRRSMLVSVIILAFMAGVYYLLTH